MAPVTDVREISRIGYGFIGSKTLFSALNFDIFSLLSHESKQVEKLAQETGITTNALEILLTACVSLGLLTRDKDGYFANAPASQTYLARDSRLYFGDYFRYQIDRQIYPVLEYLDAALAGETVTPFYEQINTSKEEVDHFIHAQHSGSIGPAYLLSKRIDLSNAHSLLDIAGGSGAFSIMLCERFPQLKATVVDFPKVIENTSRFIEEAQFTDRIDTLSGNALATQWPFNQSVVLMSYLLSIVSKVDISNLLTKAYKSLEPGGLLMIHDFVVENDHNGPLTASLFLVGSIITPGTMLLTPNVLSKLLQDAGFVNIQVQEHIPEITKLITSHKPTS